MSKDIRKRNWWFILYPESAPHDWETYLEDLHVPVTVSPLHDKDLDDLGQPKKAHYHVILEYSGKKSYSQILGITEDLCCPIPQVVNDIRSAKRYLIHKDDPDKYQYSKDDIKAFGGADFESAFEPTKSECDMYVFQMQEYCDEFNISEYSDLARVARSEHRNTWFYALNRYASYVMNLYIKSKRHAPKKHEDPETGEIL